MGYNLEDENGEVGYGLSINGLREVKQVLFKQTKAEFPAMNAFLEHGTTRETKAFARECRSLVRLTSEKDVAITLRYLAKCASQAKGIFRLKM